MTDLEAADALEKIYKCNNGGKCDWNCESCEYGVDNSVSFLAYERAIDLLRHSEETAIYDLTKTEEFNRLIKSVSNLVDELTEEIRYRRRKYH